MKFLPVHIQSTIQQCTQGDLYVKFWSIYAQLPSLCYLAKQILASSVAVICLPSSARPLCPVWLPSPDVVLWKVSPCGGQGEWCGFTHGLTFSQWLKYYTLCVFLFFLFFPSFISPRTQLNFIDQLYRNIKMPL